MDSKKALAFYLSECEMRSAKFAIIQNRQANAVIRKGAVATEESPAW